MKRPLAVFGFAFLLIMLAALRLPAAALGICAAAASAVFVLCCAVYFLHARRPRAARLLRPVAVLLGAAAMALCLLAGWSRFVLAPILALDGTEHALCGRVEAVEPGYGGDTIHARLRVLELDGGPGGFAIELRGLPAAALGQVLEANVRFYALDTTSTRLSSYAKGLYIGASPVGEVRVARESHTPLTRMRQLQYSASANILPRLPQRLSSVAAAMAVGDRRFVDADTTAAYRAAGISHVLVVSGLHLSLLCGLLRSVLVALTRRRRLACGLTMVFVLFFMAFTGLTVSVVRSGLAWLLLLGGPLLSRKSDVFTSLGAAALLLVLQNPYAAGDVGLLLSFAATLGAVGSGPVLAALRRRASARQAKKTRAAPDGALVPPSESSADPEFPRRFARARRWLAAQLCTSVCVTLATLPVLIYAGMGFSLLGPFVNLLVIPLLAPMVVCGLLMALPALPVLGWAALPATLVNGLLLRFFEWLTGLCSQADWAWVPLGGAYGLVVVLALYGLVLAGWRARRPVAGAVAAALLLPLVAGLGIALEYGTVRLTVAGGGQNAALVATRGGQAVVLYRSRLAAGAVARTLRQYRAHDCVLFVDLRATAESTEYMELFSPERVVIAGENLIRGGVYEPMDGVTVYVARQGGGMVGCVEVGGYKVGLCTGSVDLAAYAELDVLVAGAGQTTGSYGTLLCGGSVPEWADPGAEILQSDGDTLIWIRPGKSVVLRGVAELE